MKSAISIWSFPGGTPLKQAMDKAKKFGLDGIELALNEEGEMSLKSDPSDVKALLDHARSIGLGITSLATGLGWKYPPVTRDANIAAKGRQIVETGLKFAQILQVDCILSVPCTVSENLPYDEAYTRGVEVYRDLGKVAEKYGVTIGVEIVWNKFLYSPLEFARFIDDVNHPLVQAYFDVGNVLVFGFPDQWIRILGKRIAKVHVKDFRRSIGNITGFTTLLDGDVDYAAVMKALKEIGYDDYLIAEVGPINPAAPDFLVEKTARALELILAMA